MTLPSHSRLAQDFPAYRKSIAHGKYRSSEGAQEDMSVPYSSTEKSAARGSGVLLVSLSCLEPEIRAYVVEAGSPRL